MDFISNNAIETAKLAMDGLAQRHKVISANIANSQTPGYKRQDVEFESQLRNIVEVNNLKENVKTINSSMNYNLNSMDIIKQNKIDPNSATAKLIMSKNPYESFKPGLVETNSAIVSEDGNNVNIEEEMVQLAKNGTKFNVLANLESKMLSEIYDVIKGVQ